MFQQLCYIKTKLRSQIDLKNRYKADKESLLNFAKWMKNKLIPINCTTWIHDDGFQSDILSVTEIDVFNSIQDFSIQTLHHRGLAHVLIKVIKQLLLVIVELFKKLFFSTLNTSLTAVKECVNTRLFKYDIFRKAGQLDVRTHARLHIHA